MIFTPYILDKNGKKLPVEILPMRKQDAEQTVLQPKWQTSWLSDYISSELYKKYAVLFNEELIALAAYEILDSSIVVHIVYMEAQPESNPTVVGRDRKYTGIGKVLIAYGIKLSIDNGFGGDVVLEAKTTELANHYETDFGAIKLPSVSSKAPRYIIADDAAKTIFFSYLE